MTPKLQDLANKLFIVDPRTIVRAALDDFSPYAYLDLPEDLLRGVCTLSYDEQLIWDELANDYISELKVSRHADVVDWLRARYGIK